VVSILLLAALIGCIVIAMREKRISNIKHGTRNDEVEKINT